MTRELDAFLWHMNSLSLVFHSVSTATEFDDYLSDSFNSKNGETTLKMAPKLSSKLIILMTAGFYERHWYAKLAQNKAPLEGLYQDLIDKLRENITIHTLIISSNIVWMSSSKKTRWVKSMTKLKKSRVDWVHGGHTFRNDSTPHQQAPIYSNPPHLLNYWMPVVGESVAVRDVSSTTS